MNEALVLPELGDNEDSGVIVRVAVAPGDRVADGETVIEVETDKVVLDIPALTDAVIESVLVAEGDRVSVGTPLATYVTDGGAVADASNTDNADAEHARPHPAPQTDGAGDARQVTTTESPIAVPPPTEQASELKTLLQVTTVEPAAPVSAKANVNTIPAGPSARRMAREIGVDIARVAGSGEKGRISVDDVKAFARQKLSRPLGETTQVTPLPDLAAFGATRTAPLSGIEQATADNMQRAWREIPHAWLTASIDITLLEQHRQRHKAAVAEVGGGLSITVFIVKALAMLLREHPRFNASFDAVNAQLVYRDYIDIAVAADTPRGLVVPVLRAVDQMNLQQIALEMASLITRARDGKLTPKDMQGAGITLSNLGGFGVSGLHPIINWPQAAIVGVGSAEAGDGDLRLPVILGFDHRVINGADGGRFLQSLRSLLEDPFLFTLKG